MIAQGRNINTGLADDSQEIFLIGKFYFSTVNCNYTHVSRLLLYLNIHCVKRTVVFTCTALDTHVRINMITFFTHTGDCADRTVLRTLAAALTELRIDDEATQCLTDFRTALLIADMLLIFITERLQRTIVPEAAHSCQVRTAPCSGSWLRKLFQLIKIFHPAFAGYDSLQNLQHTLRTLTARYAFTTGFISV